MQNFWLKQIIYCLLAIKVTSTKSRHEFGNIAGKWKIKYGLQEDVSDLLVKTKSAVNLPLIIYDIERSPVQTNHIYFEFEIGNTKIATVEKRLSLSDIEGSFWQGVVTIKGHYFGYTQLYVTLRDPQENRIERSDQVLEVKVVRNERVDIKIFTYSAAAIMLLMFVNLGTVLDLKRIQSIFILPVGPLLGLASRYLIMPGLAICLGLLFFQSNNNLQLAMLFSAVAPSGGIANICNVFLKGNINLSLATTTVNSVLALGMLPLWIFFMGPVILHKDSTFDLPFADMAVGCVGLVLALVTGVLLRIFIPKTTRFIFRFLKPVSVFLSLTLVAVTVGINAFAFKEVTFMIFLASLFLPVFGYIITFFLSKLLRLSVTDGMTIAVETGVLNMSLPIILLEYAMEQPMADMLIVVPILSALISLFLIVVFYTVRRIFGWNTKQDFEAFDEDTFLEK